MLHTDFSRPRSGRVSTGGWLIILTSLETAANSILYDQYDIVVLCRKGHMSLRGMVCCRSAGPWTHSVPAGTDRRSNGRKFDTKLVGRDPVTDVAVLQGQRGNLKAIPLGDRDKSRSAMMELLSKALPAMKPLKVRPSARTLFAFSRRRPCVLRARHPESHALHQQTSFRARPLKLRPSNIGLQPPLGGHSAPAALDQILVGEDTDEDHRPHHREVE